MLYLFKRRIRHFINSLQPVNECFYKFASLNKKWWKGVSSNDKFDGSILYIDRTPFPLSMVVNMPFVKRMAEKYNKKIIIGLSYVHNDKQTKLMYSSYGVDDYITIDTAPWYMWIYFAYKALNIIFATNGVDKLLNLSYQGVKFGEEVYDCIIRTHSDLYTLKSMKIKYISNIAMAYANIYNAHEAFLNKYDILIYEDCDYEMQGWPKMAIHHQKKCFQITHSGLIEHLERKEDKVLNCGKITREFFEKSLKDIENSKLEKFLLKHFCGENEDYLDRYAYYKKKKYNFNEICDVLGVVDKTKKNVLVAAHAFSDTPHYAYNMVFKDYFTWLFETIRILQKNNNVNVFVKEHPTAYYYRETGSVAYYVKKYNMSNVYVLPQNFNTISIFSTMHAVVTCQGTIGLEAVIHGIPVFTAGQGYYYGFGIDNNSVNLDEYTYKMLHITEYAKPAEDQVQTAKILLYLTRKRDELKREITNISDRSVKMDWGRHDAIVAQCREINKRLLEGVKPNEDYENLLDNIRIIIDED